MTNHLIHETSPYLQQHAGNPVEWYAWNPETLRLAREQGKPILLSIGYSACHWCHVMAHESFEDAEVAALMNKLFVNIKVDREERPDLDQIYQAAHYLLVQGSGGWPLTMFLTPDQVPFYGGTYFPPTARYNLPGFADLLRKVAEAYRERKAEIQLQNQTFIESLGRRAAPQQARMPDESAIQAGIAHLAHAFDSENGGFGGAPKFPNGPDWTLLLRVAVRGDETARQMAQLTLSRMAAGGIYDHLGGGFCRYSVDERWEIPHFEKMLYDNGQLLCLYADGWLLTGEPRWSQVVEETIGWMLREMAAPQGGFYSSLDADSEGEEGRFYAWPREQVRSLLTTQEYALAAPYYGLDSTPNFEHAWHLRIDRDLAAVAAKAGMPLEQAHGLLASARAKLFAAREARIHPGLDDKLLTSWNALAIKGLARAGRVFDQPEWIAAAQRATDFIRENLWVDGRLLATCKDGKAHLNAYLDDHAFLLDALLELMQAEFRRQDINFAIELAEAMLTRFEDEAAGGFFFTSHDHEQLIQRPKPPHDNAIPSGNGVAAFALQRLGHLLGEVRYLRAAERTLHAFGGDLDANPAACPTLLCALQEWLAPPTIVIIRGEPAAMAEWQRSLSSRLLPHCLVIVLPAGMESGFPVLDKFVGTTVNAYVCRGVECLPAIHDLESLVAVL
jgi:uncharacterized protein YyaL (SSP411 family)